MRYIVQPGIRLSKINRNIYGNFSEHLGRCIYNGVFVGKDSPIDNVRGMRCDIVEALKEAKLPILRWPGGCFADEYHWKDGVGPLASRKKMINTHWGGVIEDNSFGTHEFFDLCGQIGCEPYVNGNVGSGSVQEMSEWIEYMTMDGTSPMADLRRANGREEAWPLKYFAVGNENWGCGGNMTAEFYANQYRRYQTFVRNYGANRIYKIACGPSDADYHWTDVLMREAARMMDGLSLHHYTITHTWEKKGSATDFTEEEYYKTLERAWDMETMVKTHAGIMDRYDPAKRVGLIVDEWGTWFDVEPGTNPGFLYQQNTMRDAMVAALNLNIFNKHSDRVHGANIAQLINVLQALILTDGEKMLKTPTYHVFEMYKTHQDNDLVQSAIATDRLPGAVPQVTESASVDADGTITITIANMHAADSEKIELRIDGGQYELIEARTLSDEIHMLNTFEEPDAVRPKAMGGVKCAYDPMGTEIGFDLPACTLNLLRFRKR